MLVAVLLAIVILSVVSVNSVFLPGCESCHLATGDKQEKPPQDEQDKESKTSRTPLVQTEFASHKDVQCIDCHVDRGLTNRIAYGSRMTIEMMLPLVDSSNFDGKSQFNKRCMSCHQDILDTIVEARGIRMSHSDCAVDSACASCHATVGHRAATEPEVTFSMDGCMSCHNSLAGEFRSCDTCHVQRQSSERRLTSTNWAITHGPDWEKMHGMGDLNTCQTCHSTEMCGRCHGAGVPHPEKFFGSHGDSAMSTEQNCASCHQENFCSDCHGIEMPHPSNFITRHSSVASGVADASCLRCHSVKDCETCHAAHIHPGGSIGTIDGTRESREND